ncbi:hypothetical protein NFI96_004905 [Prochilodus magdalenae]|nr:hypothetical protein NFI96_004905 [Prochilodus magdalenae]
MIMDYRKLQRGGHSPLYISGAEVEKHLFFLRRLRKFGLPPDVLTNFYRCTIESILTAYITVWYSSCTAYDRKALMSVVRTAESIIGSRLPDLQDIYRSHCLRKIQKIRLDCSHPAHDLFTLLPSGKRWRRDYRDEVSALSEWCYHNNLSLNISKTKEMIVDYRKLQRGYHSPPYISGAEMEKVSSVRFLGVHLTDYLTWALHTNKVVRSARQRLFFLRRLREFGLPPDILTNFYICTPESILTAYITVWYSSCTAYDRKALMRVVRTAESIIGSKLPDLQDIYRSHCLRKIQKIRLDCSHPAHDLFTLLPSGRSFQQSKYTSPVTSRGRLARFMQNAKCDNEGNLKQ